MGNNLETVMNYYRKRECGAWRKGNLEDTVSGGKDFKWAWRAQYSSTGLKL